MKSLTVRILVLGALLGMVSPALPAQSFEDGLQAFDEANASKDPAHDGYARAFSIWQPLAEEGHAAARYHLGILHMYGLGGAEFDQIAGFELIAAAAKEGYSQAQSYMGVLHERGDGLFTTRDPAIARDWYEKAADAGHCYSVRRLTRAYSNGELGVDRDDSAAARWREREASCSAR